VVTECIRRVDPILSHQNPIGRSEAIMEAIEAEGLQTKI
jgi:hypothetical protein